MRQAGRQNAVRMQFRGQADAWRCPGWHLLGHVRGGRYIRAPSLSGRAGGAARKRPRSPHGESPESLAGVGRRKLGSAQESVPPALFDAAEPNSVVPGGSRALSQSKSALRKSDSARCCGAPSSGLVSFMSRAGTQVVPKMNTWMGLVGARLGFRRSRIRRCTRNGRSLPAEEAHSDTSLTGARGAPGFSSLSCAR